MIKYIYYEDQFEVQKVFLLTLNVVIEDSKNELKMN